MKDLKETLINEGSYAGYEDIIESIESNCDSEAIIEICKESKKLIDDIYKQRMTDSIRDELANKNWAHAIKKILIFINYRQNGGKVQRFPKTNDWPQIYILSILIPSFFVGIIILTIILHFGSTKYIFCSEVKEFFDGAIKYWKEMNELPNNSEKRIELKHSIPSIKGRDFDANLKIKIF